MFTGIVYNKGIVKNIKKSSKYVNGSRVLEISSNLHFKKKVILASLFVVMVFVLL